MFRQKTRFRGESQILNAETRSSAPGQFIELPDGVTHYEMAGPTNGQTVVLVHGFSVPYYIWDPTFDALVKAGFRVLRYDLYGRGYSDRPDAVYNQELYERQLLHLLSGLKVDSPVNLFGLSMGGPISIVFADRHPAMVGKLCLIDPAGFPLKHSFVTRLVQAPLLGEWLMSLFGDKVLLSGLADDFHKPEEFPEYQERYQAQMKYKGFKRALLATLRSGILNDMKETYERVGKQERPTLLIWGREDRLIPFATSAKVREAMPHIEFHAIEEAGHIPHFERPEVVNPLLIKFLQKTKTCSW